MNDFLIGLLASVLGVSVIALFVIGGFWIFGPVWIFAIFILGAIVTMVASLADDIEDLGASIRRRWVK